jgi:fibrillarin-like pre-rRNA processing protein
VETTRWPGVFRDGREFYTINRTPGQRVYGETLRQVGGVEYRSWDPFRSKLAALFARGTEVPLPGRIRSLLYLGGAHGTTVSHLSDVFADAALFVVEKSPTAFAPLLALARRRENLFPMLTDAQLPERYLADVGEVDLLYQDIAQRRQAAIFVENAAVALAPEGIGLLMLKVRSVTQSRPVAAIVHEARSLLEREGFHVRSETSLAPFSRDHVAFVVSRAG